MKAFPRREFLRIGGAAAAAACASSLGSTGCAAISGISATPKAGAGSYRTDRGEIQLEIEKVPALRDPGGSCKLALTRDGAAPLRVIVLHTPDAGFLAFEDRCTHAGGQLEYHPEEKTLRCAGCFGLSRFDLSGRVLKGPAPQPVTQFRTSLRGALLGIFVAT